MERKFKISFIGTGKTHFCTREQAITLLSGYCGELGYTASECLLTAGLVDNCLTGQGRRFVGIDKSATVESYMEA